MHLENKNEEELLEDAEKSSNAIVTTPEKIITGTLSSIADGLELISGLGLGGPIVGWALWGLSFSFGIFVSAGLFIWSMFRGVNGSFFVKRLLILALGFILDEATLGILPIRTLTLIIVIWLNNHFEKKKIEEIVGYLGKAVKILERFA